MKFKYFLVYLLLFFFNINQSWAQCSLCTKTAQQLGEKPGLGMNNGILYLMATPLIIMAIIGIRWWRSENRNTENE